MRVARTADPKLKKARKMIRVGRRGKGPLDSRMYAVLTQLGRYGKKLAVAEIEDRSVVYTEL